MLMTFNDDPYLFKKVITGDESWVYDIETKVQSSQWKAFCYNKGDKRKVKTKAVGDTKKRISKIGRNAGISVLYLRRVTLKGT